MKKFVCIYIVMVLSVLSAGKAFAQDVPVRSASDRDNMDYQRSSIYSMLINSTYTYSDDIRKVFVSIPVPDKFNDHNLSVRVAPLYAVPQNEKDKSAAISQFVKDNGIARRMVAKWFLRDKGTGLCSMDQVISRGLYDVNKYDEDIAELSKRGTALLEDSGIDLIGSTFLLVNDIQYIDKERNAKITSRVFETIKVVATGVAVAASVVSDDDETAQAVESVSGTVALASALGETISDAIAGFTVKTTSYLYQLKWSDKEFQVFSDCFWADSTMTEQERMARKEAFEKSVNDFQLVYIGSYTASSQKTVLRGLHSNEDVIRKVCARAIDKNVVELQKKYEPFRVKVPVAKVGIGGRSNYLSAYIGMKEGVEPGSRYELLEKRKDKEGKISYHRVGVVAPVDNKIWDNRFMALEEGAVGADLGYTTFRLVSGSRPYSGLLLREIVK